MKAAAIPAGSRARRGRTVKAGKRVHLCLPASEWDAIYGVARKLLGAEAMDACSDSAIVRAVLLQGMGRL